MVVGEVVVRLAMLTVVSEFVGNMVGCVAGGCRT